MAMTVQELRDVLDQACEMGLGESELRFAYQPNYPLQDKVDGIWFDEEKAKEADVDPDAEQPLFYIVSAGQDYDSPYAPRVAFENSTTAL